MKPIFLVSLLASLVVIAECNPVLAEEAPKPTAAKPLPITRKITVQLLGKDGAKLAEATVPAVQEDPDGDIYTGIPLFQPGAKRWELDISIDERGTELPALLSVKVNDLDRSTRYDSEKGQAIMPVQSLLRVTTTYKGPGTYEIYRSLEEKLVIVIE